MPDFKVVTLYKTIAKLVHKFMTYQTLDVPIFSSIIGLCFTCHSADVQVFQAKCVNLVTMFVKEHTHLQWRFLPEIGNKDKDNSLENSYPDVATPLRSSFGSTQLRPRVTRKSSF